VYETSYTTYINNSRWHRCEHSCAMCMYTEI